MSVLGDSYFIVLLCRCGYGRSKVINDDPSVASDLSKQTLEYWNNKHYLTCNKKPYTSHITQQ